MAILKPDNKTTFGGVTVNEYLLTKHNPNHIAMPSVSMEGKVIGVTVHNTAWITTAAGTTPAEQYTRATVNGNMNDVRVPYYVDNMCAWQNLPLSLSGWHAADGSGNGNRRTVSIECIMSSAYNSTDKKSEDNCARLAAALLKKYGLDINHLYPHPLAQCQRWQIGQCRLSQYSKKLLQDVSALHFASLVGFQEKGTGIYERWFCNDINTLCTCGKTALQSKKVLVRCQIADRGFFFS